MQASPPTQEYRQMMHEDIPGQYITRSMKKYKGKMEKVERRIKGKEAEGRKQSWEKLPCLSIFNNDNDEI